MGSRNTAEPCEIVHTGRQIVAPNRTHATIAQEVTLGAIREVVSEGPQRSDVPLGSCFLQQPEKMQGAISPDSLFAERPHSSSAKSEFGD